MRRSLVILFVAGALASGAPAGWAQTGGAPGSGGNDGGTGGSSNGQGRGSEGSKGSNGGSSSRSSSGNTKNLRVGPNAKLGTDEHNLTLAGQFTCSNDTKYNVQGRARQGDTVSTGSSTLQCSKGVTKSFTVVTKDSDDEFETGQADACLALTKAGSNAKPQPVCRKVTVIT